MHTQMRIKKDKTFASCGHATALQVFRENTQTTPNCRPYVFCPLQVTVHLVRKTEYAFFWFES